MLDEVPYNSGKPSFLSVVTCSSWWSVPLCSVLFSYWRFAGLLGLLGCVVLGWGCHDVVAEETWLSPLSPGGYTLDMVDS